MFSENYLSEGMVVLHLGAGAQRPARAGGANNQSNSNQNQQANQGGGVRGWFKARFWGGEEEATSGAKEAEEEQSDDEKAADDLLKQIIGEEDRIRTQLTTESNSLYSKI